MTRIALLLAKEPVRVYLYGVLGTALLVLGAYGVLSGQEIAVWGALGASVLAVPAVEKARARVKPVWKDEGPQLFLEQQPGRTED